MKKVDAHFLRHLIDAVKKQFLLSLKKEVLLRINHEIEYIHKRNLYHDDLKSGNVLFTGNAQDFIFKLCDVGRANYTRHYKLVWNMSVQVTPEWNQELCLLKLLKFSSKESKILQAIFTPLL